MTFGQIRTLADAREWLLGEPEVRREQAHMLGLMFGAEVITGLIRELDIKLTGKPGV